MFNGGILSGLCVLAMRVDALGGSCGVTHRNDGKQGSKFWFTVPYHPDDSASQRHQVANDESTVLISQQNTSHEVPVPAVRDAPKLNILLVDDSLSIIKMSSMMLKREGEW